MRIAIASAALRWTTARPSARSRTSARALRESPGGRHFSRRHHHRKVGRPHHLSVVASSSSVAPAMSPTDANAPECTSDVPPGLQAHAETRLRNAYAHAAAARRRELDAAHASTDPSAFAADPASDADARDPPDPTEGIAATIDALKTLARREVAEAAVRARGDHHLGDHDGDEAHAKRPRMTAARTRMSGPSDPSGPPEPPTASSSPAKGKKRRRVPNVAARFDASARSMATAMRASWPVTRARAHPRSHRRRRRRGQQNPRATRRVATRGDHHAPQDFTQNHRQARWERRREGCGNRSEPRGTDADEFSRLFRRSDDARDAPRCSRSVFGARRRVARTRVTRRR